MKNINLVKHLKFQKLRHVNGLFARSKNDWDPIKTYYYNPTDEHVEPKDEEIIREIFDRDYYKFGFKAQSDNHEDVLDKFSEYRQWQHLYVHSKDPVIGWTHGWAWLKYAYMLMPVFFIFFFVKVLPIFNRENIGRRTYRKYNVKI